MGHVAVTVFKGSFSENDIGERRSKNLDDLRATAASSSEPPMADTIAYRP